MPEAMNNRQPPPAAAAPAGFTLVEILPGGVENACIFNVGGRQPPGAESKTGATHVR